MASKEILCALKHTMVPIVDGLWLCECSSYGRLASRKGAGQEPAGRKGNQRNDQSDARIE